MITLERADWNYVIRNDDGRDLLVELDWDYPGVASTFGWSLSLADNLARAIPYCRSGHAGTDGTVDCDDCGMTASMFINDAAAWLDDNIGVTADDPGYFERIEA